MFQSVSPVDVLVAFFAIGASLCVAISIILIACPKKFKKPRLKIDDLEPLQPPPEHSFEVWHTGGKNPCHGLAWTWITHPLLAGGGSKNALLPNGKHPDPGSRALCGTCGNPIAGGDDGVPVTIKMVPKVTQ